MASIQKRGNTFRVRISRRPLPAITKTFLNRSEAVLWAKETEAQLHLGIYEATPSQSPTSSAMFSELAEYYINHHSIYKKSGKTEAGILRILSRRWKDLEIQKVGKTEVLNLRDDLLKQERSHDTINHYFNAISNLFQAASEERDLEVINPMKTVRRMSPAAGRTRRVDTAAEQTLLRACRTLSKPLLGSIIEFAIQTGMRRSEIMGLLWSDIDLKKRIAYLHVTKNGEARKVPLTQAAVRILSDLDKHASGKVFPMTLTCLRSQFETVIQFAQRNWSGHGNNPFEGLRFHDCRHEALSRLSDAGLNAIELAHISGHKTLGQLKRYTHPSHQAIFLKLDLQNDSSSYKHVGEQQHQRSV